MPTSSDDVTYLAPYLGGVSRTLTSKLAEYVTPEDFGAVGNGSADDTAAVQAALDTGHHVLLLNHYRISSTLIVKKRGQRIFGEAGTGTATTERVNISVGSGSTITPVISVGAQAVTIQNVVIEGPGAGVANSVLIFAQQEWNETGTGSIENKGDVDLKIVECALVRSYQIIRIKGRGLNVQTCNIAFFKHAIDIEWPDENFVEGDNFDQTALSGMRSYVIRNNRFHAGSDGYLVRNITSDNSENIHGLLFIGNYADTNCRIFTGKINESSFLDNILIHSNSKAFIFSITGGDSIRIAGNMFYGMTDNGLRPTEKDIEDGKEIVSTCEIMGGIQLADTSNVSIHGNHFKRVERDVLSLNGECRNILFQGNVMKDVCLDNNILTEPLRYAVRVNNAVSTPAVGLIISENTVDNEEMARNAPMVGLPAGAGALTGLVVRDNLLPSFMSTHDLPAVTRQSVTNTTREALAYDGDGATSKTVTLRFAPVFVSVTIVTGMERGRTIAVSAGSTAGSDLVQISGRDVLLKGDWNVSGTTYTLHAFT
ncbi:hypothetical protein [Tistrella mobilis]|uniref:hypothetical protein n=1 Tax=Tistrella mobilis TaxID=171437 RepID=UPI0035571652